MHMLMQGLSQIRRSHFLGGPIENTVCTSTDGCFERFWTWPRPKAMGRVRYRYSLRDALPRTSTMAPDLACVRLCVKQGSKYGLWSGDHVYILEPQSRASKV